jgi:hypothetical protein
MSDDSNKLSPSAQVIADERRDLRLLEQLRAHPELHCFVGYLDEGELNGPNTAECCAIVLQLLRGGGHG